MNKSIKKLVAGTVLVLSAFSAFAADPIKIGSVLSVTGPAAFLGEPELQTLQLYIEEINKSGGVIGRQLQLVHYDDGSDAGKANGFTKRLLDDDKVDLVIGGTTTGATMSMVPLIEKAGIPFISLAGAVVVVEPVKKFTFKVSHTDRMAAEKIYEDMKKRGITKVALFSETSGFGQSGRKESELMASKMGITLVANETFGPKDTDMSPQLTKIKNTPEVQAVYIF
ncbi:MAG: ABC transporter substrate-binding protein, partial [Betaproteobacteria bacterium]